MNKLISNKKLIGILIAVIVIVTLIAFSLNGVAAGNPIQKITNDVSAAVGRVVSRPFEAVFNTFETADDVKNTYQENKQLKRQIKDASAMQAQIDALEAENASLETEMNLRNSLTDYETIQATVISRSPDDWSEELVINKGSQDGLEKEMSVLSQYGLVGRVTEVSLTSSKVTLLSTPKQRNNLVSAEIVVGKEGSTYGVVSGYDDTSQRLIMSQVTSETELEEGLLVMTSGLSDKTPRSLLIGTIDEVDRGGFGLTQEVYIKPAADFNDIRYVTIVKRALPGSQEIENAAEVEMSEEDES